MRFLASEKNRQAEWKLSTKYLSRQARSAGLYRGRLYPWALPVTYSDENIQESIRQNAIRYFEENRISWHMAAQMEGPTNHLCSSQVMCVNTLFPFFHESDLLGDLLRPIFPDMERMLPIESPGQFLAFEWIGPRNYLNEEPKLGDTRHRGLGNTSVDWACMMKTKDNKTRMILGEFKYVEAYAQSNIRYRNDRTDRLITYKPFLEDPNCPIDITRLESLDDLFYEPIYQATRLLLFAREVRKHHSEIDEVITVHIRSERNRAILKNPSKGLPQEGTVYDSIRALLHDPRLLIDVTYEDLFRAFSENHQSRELKYLKSRYPF